MMVAFGKDKLVSIRLSEEEQSCILQHCQDLTPALQNKIKHTTDGTIYLMEGETDILIGILGCAIQETNNKKIADLFEKLANRIPFSNEITKQLDRLDGIDCTDAQAVEQVWKELDEEKKTAPDPNRGYLTPQQITRFQEYHWGNVEFPLQFNHNLSLEEVSHSTFFRNTRLFLKKLMEFKDEPTATVKGNLNRKFVKLMFDEMELDEEYRERTRKYYKVLNERDIFPLHIIKTVCKIAGLINKRSNKILIPQKYHTLLSEEQAGELYYLLFETYYNKFNLSYPNRLPKMDGIQDTLDFSLYRLSVICNDFQSVDDLYYEVFLPTILYELEEVLTKYTTEGSIVSSMIIYHLVGFGLLECKYKQEKYFNRIDQARKTSLFDRFLSLNL